MRKMAFVLLFLIGFLLTMALFIGAQDDDKANYCYDGTWYCPDPDHPAREKWNWACGWYFAHRDAGLISEAEVPSWCFVPKPVPPTPTLTPEPRPDSVPQDEATPGP